MRERVSARGEMEVLSLGVIVEFPVLPLSRLILVWKFFFSVFSFFEIFRLDRFFHGAPELPF